MHLERNTDHTWRQNLPGRATHLSSRLIGTQCHHRAGLRNTDFSFTKDMKITERLNLQFRTDMFNFFHHENFCNPVLTATSGSFGFIGATRFPTGDFGSSRQIQFSLSLQF